ncbi:hypothetical protein N3K63_06495 [Microbacterium sp. W1N]|uniref:hypothetical protein n=1 Tax=Microbacterium festucae TaxID=2977531 RepID=UPI0021C0ED44|nr:hypothetical protein [Microbacterium festucae]MCT9819937.1 hypothetical protein [Microbacterium festucae]
MIRRSAVAAMLVALTLGATACTPTAEPTPTPTGFASDEEAFAAAEATYREYVDALNAVDLSEPATFEDVYAWLTGDALDAAKKSLTQMHSDGWVVDGNSVVSQVVPNTLDSDAGLAELDVCLDVSKVTLVDEQGISQSGDRPTEQAFAVDVNFDGDSWLISKFAGREGPPECLR